MDGYVGHDIWCIFDSLNNSFSTYNSNERQLEQSYHKIWFIRTFFQASFLSFLMQIFEICDVYIFIIPFKPFGKLSRKILSATYFLILDLLLFDSH